VDLAGYDDIDLLATEIADPIEELRQDVYHRCIEPYGSNPDIEANRSLGLEEVLHGAYDGSLPGIVQAGLSLDERIEAVKATVDELEGTTTAGGARAVRLNVEIAVDEGELGIVLDLTTDGIRRIA